MVLLVPLLTRDAKDGTLLLGPRMNVGFIPCDRVFWEPVLVRGSCFLVDYSKIEGFSGRIVFAIGVGSRIINVFHDGYFLPNCP